MEVPVSKLSDPTRAPFSKFAFKWKQQQQQNVYDIDPTHRVTYFYEFEMFKNFYAPFSNVKLVIDVVHKLVMIAKIDWNCKMTSSQNDLKGSWNQICVIFNLRISIKTLKEMYKLGPWLAKN